MKALGLFCHGPGVIHSKTPIVSVADRRGVKLRAPTRVTAKMVETLGATPVGMPVPAVAEALPKGVIDASIIPWEVDGGGSIRPKLEGDMPTASAIVARLQCAALGGVSCTVFAITFSRTSLGRGGTREGRVLSRLSPGTPSSGYRSCQRQTVGFDLPVRRMISTEP